MTESAQTNADHGRCELHGLAAGADGLCVICRRNDPRRLAASRRSLVVKIVVGSVLLCGLFGLLAGSIGLWLGRRIEWRPGRNERPLLGPRSRHDASLQQAIREVRICLFMTPW